MKNKNWEMILTCVSKRRVVSHAQANTIMKRTIVYYVEKKPTVPRFIMIFLSS